MTRRSHTSAKQRKRKKAGNAWEAEIERENDLLFELDRAALWRSWDAIRVVGTLPNGHVDGIRARKSEPDFHGVLSGGLAVSFDAKRTTKDRFEFPDPKKPKQWFHQVVALSNVTRFGGVGFLYVLRDHEEDPFARRRYVLPCYRNTIAGKDPTIDRSLDLTTHPTALVVPNGSTWFDVVADNLNEWSANR